MYMGTHFLARLGRSKDTDDRESRLLRYLRSADIAAKYGIVLGWCCLIVVDAVQPHAKDFHDGR